MKKLLTIMLSLAMLFSVASPLFADEAEDLSVIMEQSPFEYLITAGEVIDIQEADEVIFLTLKPIEEEAYEVVLKVYNETAVADAKTGEPANVEEIKEGDKIKAYYSPIMTKSLPPQTNAFAVLTGYEEDEFSFDYLQVKEVEESEDGDIRVLSGNGDYYITISADLPLKSFKTKDIPAISDITPGAELLVYYEIMALSYPGQTSSLNTIIISTPDNEEDAAYPVAIDLEQDEILIYGDVCKLEEGEKIILLENGDVLIPARRVLEALGFTVTWDDADRSVHVAKDDVETLFVVGTNNYENQKTKSILPNSELIDSKTYIPFQVLGDVLEVEAVISIG